MQLQELSLRRSSKQQTSYSFLMRVISQTLIFFIFIITTENTTYIYMMIHYKLNLTFLSNKSPMVITYCALT